MVDAAPARLEAFDGVMLHVNKMCLGIVDTFDSHLYILFASALDDVDRFVVLEKEDITAITQFETVFVVGTVASAMIAAGETL